MATFALTVKYIFRRRGIAVLLKLLPWDAQVSRPLKFYLVVACFHRTPELTSSWRRAKQVIPCDSWSWGSNDGDFDVGKYRDTAEIKQQLNQWGARLVYNAWGAFPQTDLFKALEEEAQTGIKYSGWGQIIGLWSRVWTGNQRRNWLSGINIYMIEMNVLSLPDDTKNWNILNQKSI